MKKIARNNVVSGNFEEANIVPLISEDGIDNERIDIDDEKLRYTHARDRIWGTGNLEATATDKAFLGIVPQYRIDQGIYSSSGIIGIGLCFWA